MVVNFLGVQFMPFQLHSVHGPPVTLSYNFSVAERRTGEYACGYVFTSRPLNFNEKIVVQVRLSFVGCLLVAKIEKISRCCVFAFLVWSHQCQ